MLHSDETRTYQFNIRINAAEKKLLERLQLTIRPRVSMSRLLIYLAEEKGQAEGIIKLEEDGTWLIAE